MFGVGGISCLPTLSVQGFREVSKKPLTTSHSIASQPQKLPYQSVLEIIADFQYHVDLMSAFKMSVRQWKKGSSKVVELETQSIIGQTSPKGGQVDTMDTYRVCFPSTAGPPFNWFGVRCTIL